MYFSVISNFMYIADFRGTQRNGAVYILENTKFGMAMMKAAIIKLGMEIWAGLNWLGSL
jgi:hypothetical protein